MVITGHMHVHLQIHMCLCLYTEMAVVDNWPDKYACMYMYMHLGLVLVD